MTTTSNQKNKKSRAVGSDPRDPKLQWLPANLRQYVKCKTTTFKFYDRLYEVRTFSVHACSANGQIRRFGSDDFTYKNNPELLVLVPRGFSELYDGKELVYTLKGQPKFDGTSAIDEDDSSKDDVPISQYSFLNTEKIQKWAETNTLRVHWQEKANGKFAIFTLLTLYGKEYIFGGSKNVHVLVELDSNISFKSPENQLHYEILQCIVANLRNLSSKQLTELHSRTVVGEYVDGMHLVWTPKPYMVYFSGYDNIDLPTVSNVLPVQHTIPTADQLTRIRNIENVEGVVLVYENIKTGEKYRQKHKSIWYILLRCWREILSKKTDDTDINLLIDACQRRTHERSRDFLHCTPEELQKYDLMVSNLVRWIARSKYSFKDVSPFGGVGMARIYNEYMSDPIELDGMMENMQVDRKSFQATPDEILEIPELYKTVLSLSKAGHKVCVIVRGLPGCGKTTVSDSLEKELVKMRVSVSRHCTDNFFMVGSEYIYDSSMIKENHEKNYNVFTKSTTQVKINENTNTVLWEYAKYMSHARNMGYVCIVLDCKIAPIHELALRNSHEVPEAPLRKMMKRFKRAIPQYYGVFFNNDTVPSQTTPSHITCQYIGGNAKSNTVFETIRKRLGDTVTVCKKGMSLNESGVALVVDFVDDVDRVDFKTTNTPHITLRVNDKNSAVMVGQNIRKDNTSELEEELIHGVFAPMY